MHEIQRSGLSDCDGVSIQNQAGVLTERIFEGFTITETQYAPCTTLPTHFHAKPSFCFMLKGEAMEIVGSDRVVAQPGVMLLRPAGLRHSNHYGPLGLRGFMVEFEEKWLETCRHLVTLFNSHKEFRGGRVAELAVRIFRESRIKDSVAPIIVEGLMLEMLGYASRSLVRPPARVPSWLSQARDLLHGHFNNQLNLMEIANSVGVHPTHLSRTFKKHYRTTMGEYLRQLRLDWATSQLSETEESIAQIAAAAGFYDQSHFSHLFKERTGFTPAEFRASTNRTQKS